MVVIDRIPLIVVQFRFSTPEALPPFIKSKGREMAKHLPFVDHTKGEQVIKRTKNCSASALPVDLARTKYQMVGATYAERTGLKGGHEKEYTITFTFVHGGLADPFLAEPSKELKKWEDFVNMEFKTLCSSALHELQVFANPIYRDGKEVLDQKELRVNLIGNIPLFRSDGKPVLVYPRDEQGRVTGFGKPLKPEMNLTFVGNEFVALERTVPE